jgi:hypothetical protein
MERSMIRSGGREFGLDLGVKCIADGRGRGGQVASVANPAVAAVRPSSNGRVSATGGAAPRRTPIGMSLFQFVLFGIVTDHRLFGRRWTGACSIRNNAGEPEGIDGIASAG